jgi:hypothetical protein
MMMSAVRKRDRVAGGPSVPHLNGLSGVYATLIDTYLTVQARELFFRKMGPMPSKAPIFYQPPPGQPNRGGHLHDTRIQDPKLYKNAPWDVLAQHRVCWGNFCNEIYLS